MLMKFSGQQTSRLQSSACQIKQTGQEKLITISLLKWPGDGEEDFSCTFQFAWSYTHFFVFVEVTDDIEHSWNGTSSNSWEFDNIEFFFQLDTNTRNTTYSENTIQIRFNRGTAGWAFPGRAEPSDYLTYWTNTEAGWLLEAGIPYTAALPEGTITEDMEGYLPLIGFDLSVFDSDNSNGIDSIGNTELQLVWDDDDLDPGTDVIDELLFNNTALFGYASLVGIPVSVNELSENDMKNVSIFPNPAGDRLYLSNDNSFSEVKIYSTTGELILSKALTGSSFEISKLSPGIYIAIFDNTESHKIIKL
jgi:hypothetical protein